MPGPGRLITFEGGEGAGKSTQIGRLAEALRRFGREVVVTREPGGTAGAEAIRELVLAGKTDRWQPLTETLLMLAARHDHVSRRVAPALAAGTWVLSDRFMDSTRVYQGIAGAVGLDLIDQLHQVIFDRLAPDLTLILDLPVASGLERRRASAETNRIDQMTEAFHERVRAGFLALARREPDRCIVIDADQPVGQVAAAVLAAVATHLEPGLTIDRRPDGARPA